MRDAKLLNKWKRRTYFLNRIVYPTALGAIPMYFRWVVRGESVTTFRTLPSKQRVSV
jgi:hypothetical protein